MCLITFAYNAHPDYKFILAANRDEFYSRPTSVAKWWDDHSTVLGGRDLLAMGTWMAIHKTGKFSAVTNFRDIKNIRPDAQSRGDLPVEFLISDAEPEAYGAKVFTNGAHYNGFNLITLQDSMTHVSNHDKQVNLLSPGIYGLSNALLDTPWPKVTKAKKEFTQLINEDFELTHLIEMMKSTEAADDSDLPDTGLDYEREKALSAMCIRTPDYGTCCTTAVTIAHNGKVQFMEKSYPVGDRKDETVFFEFNID